MEYNINVNLEDETIEVFFPKEYDENFKNSIDIVEDLKGRICAEYDFFRLFYYATCYERDFDFKKLNYIFYAPLTKERKFSKIFFFKGRNDYLIVKDIHNKDIEAGITFVRKKPNLDPLYYYYDRWIKKMIE